MCEESSVTRQPVFRHLSSRSRERLRGWGALTAGLGLAALLCHAAMADKGLNDGIYRDREDKPHTWSIHRSHLLVWDDKPYTPAGVVFHSAYLKAPSADSLKQDEAELDHLRQGGIEDVWVEPGRGLLQCTPAQTQTLVDALESRGLRYGLRVGDRFREPLIGFAPNLAVTRIPAAKMQPGARLQYEVSTPGARRAVYALTETGSPDLTLGSTGADRIPDDRQQNWAIQTGEVVVERDTAAIQLQLRRSALLGKAGALLHIVPEIQAEPEELGGFGDLWAGMPTYAARLKQHLQAVKFGAGLRFILDPFAAGDGALGEEDQVFPSSPAFRKAFQDWLQRRSGIQTLNINWRTTDRRIPGFEEAARMVPTWSRNDPPEGDGWIIDPVDHVAYRCKPRQSAIWSDLDEFRAETLKKWMNSVTTTLKQEGLNVPMLFSWSAYHPIFNNGAAVSGYDGLGAQLAGKAPEISTESGAYALAQAEEASRNSWLIATRVSGAAEGSGNPAPFTDAGQARTAWEALRDTGFRGVFLDPQTDPAAVTIAKELAPRLTADQAAMEARVPTCFFPMPLATTDRVTRLSNGVWWLPSSKSARLLRYGDTILGYDIDQPFGEEHLVKKGTVLWSTKGPQLVSFYIDKYSEVMFYDSAGNPLKVKPKSKTELQVPLSGEPVVATGVDVTSLFPVELAMKQLDEFDALLREAEAQKLPQAQLRPLYNDAKRGIGPNSAASVYQYVSPLVEQLRAQLAPFVWVEGERSVAHNFSGTTFQAGTSGGTYLKLDRKDPPPSGIYRARYNITIRRDASYEVWMAGRVPGSPGVSPLIWQIDEEPALEAKKVEPVDQGYARGMAWFMLGRVTLKQGVHELTLVVPKRAEGPNGRYSAGIDAIVFSREAFKPQGATKPYDVVRSSPAPRADEESPSGDKKSKAKGKGGKNSKSAKDAKDAESEKAEH